MIRVGSLPLARSLALSGAVVIGATLFAMPAHAASGVPLPVEITVTQDGAQSISDVRWELPADAVPGDVLTLALPAHVGAVAGADWIASSGESIGVVRVDRTGAAAIELNAAAADPGNRRGEVRVRTVLGQASSAGETSESTAGAILRPGERPGPFFGVPDRTRGNVYGAWTDETETRARWVLESPRGPWDTLDVVDRAGAGQRVECTAAVRVRATSAVDATTGYLVDPVDVPADRVTVVCGDTEVRVHVEPVGDEIVEITFETVPDIASTEVADEADFTAVRSVPGEPTPTPTPTPTSSPSPSPSFEPGPTAAPTPRPTAVPTPSVVPVGETPSVTPIGETLEPDPSGRDRLAVTGSDASLPAGIGALLLLAGVAVGVHGRWARSRV